MRRNMIIIAGGLVLLTAGLTLFTRAHGPSSEQVAVQRGRDYADKLEREVAALKAPSTDPLVITYNKELAEYERVQDDPQKGYVHAGILADLSRRRGRYDLYESWVSVQESNRKISHYRTLRQTQGL